MRLALILLRSRVNPGGHMFRGKYRKVKPVTTEDIQKLKNEFAIEERNMFLLRHPYLTIEQSHGHAKSLGLPEKKFGEVLKEKQLKFKEHVRIEDRLNHLVYKEAWE